MQNSRERTFARVFHKVSTCKHATLHTLLKKRLRHKCFLVTFEILKLYAVLPHSCLRSFPLANLQEGELCQIYTNTFISRRTRNFHNKWVLDINLNVVTNKDQSINIH